MDATTCSYCQQILHVDEEVLVIHPATVQPGQDGTYPELKHQSPKICHPACMALAALDEAPRVKDKLYREVLEDIRDEGMCPMCSATMSY